MAHHDTAKIGLVQINNGFHNQNYLPYTIGLLQAYAQQHLAEPDRFDFLPPLYKRLPVAEGVAYLGGVDAAFFSVYVWNMRLSLAIAKQLKADHPDTLIVFGGPQVPDANIETFLREHAFVDLCVHSEGERSFLKILEGLKSGIWEAVPSLSYCDASGQFQQTERAQRIKDMDSIPSPFLAGVFAPLMRAYPEERWIGLWETNRGCPFSCTFCDWGSATKSKIYRYNLDTILQEIDWFSEKQVEFIFCCDANFGILPRDLEIVQRMAAIKAESGYPTAFSVQNTKNPTTVSYEIQRVMNDAGLSKGVLLGIQSTNEETLVQVKRANISTQKYLDIQKKFTSDNMETFTDLILALPGETYDSFVEGGVHAGGKRAA